MTPNPTPSDYPRWGDVAALIHASFAYMEPLLGHPARAASVTPAMLADAATKGTAFVISHDDRPIACVFTRASRDMPGALYLGWLAVADSYRGRGLAGDLMTAAEAEARAREYTAMTLDTGRALTDLHGFFRNAGFSDVPGDGEVVTFLKPLI